MHPLVLWVNAIRYNLCSTGHILHRFLHLVPSFSESILNPPLNPTYSNPASRHRNNVVGNVFHTVNAEPAHAVNIILTNNRRQL